MGADREPGATTTYRTPPSSSDATATRADATDVSAGSGAGWSGVPITEAAGSAGSWEVTEPVCHQPKRLLASSRPYPNPSSHPHTQRPTLPHFSTRSAGASASG